MKLHSKLTRSQTCIDLNVTISIQLGDSSREGEGMIDHCDGKSLMGIRWSQTVEEFEV